MREEWTTDTVFEGDEWCPFNSSLPFSWRDEKGGHQTIFPLVSSHSPFFLPNRWEEQIINYRVFLSWFGVFWCKCLLDSKKSSRKGRGKEQKSPPEGEKVLSPWPVVAYLCPCCKGKDIIDHWPIQISMLFSIIFYFKICSLHYDFYSEYALYTMIFAQTILFTL